MTLQIVILAAGMGSRLGRSLPKPLTELNDGRSIIPVASGLPSPSMALGVLGMPGMTAYMGPLRDREAQLDYVNFYAHLHQLVDAKIGRLTAALGSAEDPGSLRSRTVVVRCADHGEMGLSHGGLRQKTSIVLALVRPFSLLLVDEPFVGLDQPGKIVLLELLAEALGDRLGWPALGADPEAVAGRESDE